MTFVENKCRCESWNIISRDSVHSLNTHSREHGSVSSWAGWWGSLSSLDILSPPFVPPTASSDSLMSSRTKPVKGLTTQTTQSAIFTDITPRHTRDWLYVWQIYPNALLLSDQSFNKIKFLDIKLNTCMSFKWHEGFCSCPLKKKNGTPFQTKIYRLSTWVTWIESPIKAL